MLLIARNTNVGSKTEFFIITRNVWLLGVSKFNKNGVFFVGKSRSWRTQGETRRISGVRFI